MKNKQYKIIISDFDGTLVDKSITITPRVSASIKKWIDAGNMFAIATGRQYLMIKKECDRLGLTTPMVVRGGAEIVDPKTGNILYSSLMKKESVEKLVKMLQEKGFKLSIEVGDTYYTDFYYDERFKDFIKYEKVENFKYADIPKVIASCSLTSPLSDQMHEVIKEFPELHIAQVKLYDAKGWDITAANATKHIGVLELMKLLDVDREQAIGVGDGYNDFPLLEACGLKVAMGNAVEDLKAIADIIVPSQEEDGVAFLIEKLLKE